MKKLLLLLLMTVRLCAQVQPVQPGQGVFNGTLYANGYANWSVPQGTNGPFSWSSNIFCTASSGGSTFPAFTVGTPITILDQQNPATNEVVTVTAVNITPNACSISTSTPQYTHNQFSLTTSTAGLQEAINANLGTSVPTIAVLTDYWYLLGGSIAQVTSTIKGNSKIGIVDETKTPYVWYQWSGSNYVAVSVGGCSSGSCVTLLNGLTNSINLVSLSPSSLTIGTSGQNINFTVNGTAGSGTVGSGGPWNVTSYGSSAAAAVIPNPTLFDLSSSTTNSQINTLLASLNFGNNGTIGGTATILIPDGVAQQYWFNQTATVSSGNPGVHMEDLRLGARTTTVAQYGVVCDAQVVHGVSVVAGSNQATPQAYTVSTLDIGKTVALEAYSGGVQTSFLPTITGVNIGSGTWTLSTNSPFTETAGFVPVGHDNQVALQNMMTGLGTSGYVGQFPAGCNILTSPVLWNNGQSMIGQAPGSVNIISMPGEDIFVTPDAAGQGSVNKPGLIFADLNLMLDINVNASFPWNLVNASGGTTAEAPLYRPIDTNTANANNPLAPGWAVNATNGVASITQNSAVICVPTALGRMPVVGQQIVFRDTPTAFASTVSTLTGSCTTGFSPATMAAALPNTAGYTIAQAEWISTTSIQNLGAAMSAGTITYPLTITLANTTQPIPGFESNFATHGHLKIGSEQYDYLGITTSSPYQIVLRSGPTTTAGWPTGTAVEPMNPCYANYAVPWPVVPTINTGNSTPAGAVYFPGECVGNAAISMPQANGNTFVGVGWSNAHIIDIQVSGTYATNLNNTAGLYMAGNMSPYETTIDGFTVHDTTFGIVEGPASAGNHGVAAVGPTGAGNHINNCSIAATYNIHLVDWQNGGIDTCNTTTTEQSPYDETAIGPAMAFALSPTLDEQNGAVVTTVSYFTMKDVTAEPEGGNHDEVQPYAELDCYSCQYINDFLEGSQTLIGGRNQQFQGGQMAGLLNLPTILYGASLTIKDVIGIQSGNVTEVFGTTNLLNWGTLNRISTPAAQYQGPSVGTMIGAVQSWDGADNQAIKDGLGLTPYVHQQAGYIDASEFTTNSAIDAAPFTVASAVDTTSPTGFSAKCNVTTSGGCFPSGIDGFGGYIFFGNGNRLNTIKYKVTVAFDTPAGANSFIFRAGVTNPTGTACAYPTGYNTVNQTITTTGSWQTAEFIADFTPTGTVGCTLQLGFGYSSSNTVLRVAYVNFTPIPAEIPLQVASPTIGAACTVPGTILGSDTSNLYICRADSTVQKIQIGTSATTVCAGSFTFYSGAIASGAKSPLQQISCPGLLTTDVPKIAFASDPSSVTGLTPSTAGGIVFYIFPTSGQINYYEYNNTVSTVTLGSINGNYSVQR